MVKPIGLLQEPLLESGAGNGRRVLGKHDSAIEQFVASQPLRPEDVVYPTNIAVVAATPTTVSLDDVSYQQRLDHLLENLPGQSLAGFVTMALFAGYASLFSLQHVIKTDFGIPDDDSTDSHNFSFAITCMYVCNLVFRMGHNVILGSVSPRMRALIGLVCMSTAMVILAIFVVAFQIKAIWLVAVAYSFGGIAVGTFETNYSVVLAALGHRTKIIGISGIPIGIFLVIVPGFIAVTAGLPVEYIYWSVFAMLMGGMAILLNGLTFPEIDWLLSSAESIGGGDLDDGLEDIEVQARESEAPGSLSWVMPVVSVGLVFTVNMLVVSAFSPGVLLYLYNTPRIPIATPWWSGEVLTGYFFAIFSSFGFIADVVSRKRVYSRKPSVHPVWFLPFTMLGVVVIGTGIPAIAPLGTLSIFFGNGSIYAQSCRWIDMRIKRNLVFANSLFFFLGDCGSVIGSILIPFIRDLMA